jgi:membrane protease YdiL (CAAX protease family)
VTTRALVVPGRDRLRAPWRVLLFLLALAGGWIAANAVAYPIVDAIARWRGAPITVWPWLWVLAAGLAHVAMLEWADPQPWSAVGLGRAAWRPRLLARGAGHGLLLLAGVVAIGVVAGHFRLQPAAGGAADALGEALRMAWVLAPAALWEELAFRGYLFRTTAETWGPRAAIVATSAAFAIVHADNPGAGPVPLAVVAAAGAWLGAVRVVTGSVAAAWAAHVAWNWGLAAVAHADVSGLAFQSPGWRLVETGPDWLTGGRWGPEGGAYALLAFGVAAAWTLRRPMAAPPAP